MSNEQNNTPSNTNNTTQFGVGADIKSKNATPFPGGLNKGILIDVKREEVGKDTKWKVLSFMFTDLEGIKTYKHSEFMVEQNDANAKQKMDGMNSRLKHIYETYAPFPQQGLGFGAQSWDDFFDKIATAFKTGREGNKPVYYMTEGDKEVTIPVWLKIIYKKDGNITFPLSPNFIERIKADSAVTPKTLVIDKRYDVIEQPNVNKGNVNHPNVLGGENTNSNDFGAF